MTHQDTWQTYVESWKTQDIDKKKALMSRSLSSDIHYNDPLMNTEGFESLLVYMKQFHEQSAGAYFVTTRFLSHGLNSAANWDLVSPEGTKIGEGISFGKYNQEGLLVETQAFYQVPA